jgi:hypothetical protein
MRLPFRHPDWFRVAELERGIYGRIVSAEAVEFLNIIAVWEGGHDADRAIRLLEGNQWRP